MNLLRAKSTIEYDEQNRVVRTPEQIEANRQEIARKLAVREQCLDREEPAPIIAAGLSASKTGGDHG